MKLLVIIITVILITSCGQRQERKELYCGLEMSGFEVMDYKQMGNKGYDYTDADLDLLADITTAVHELFDNKYEIEVFFAHKDKDKIALYIIAPDDKAIVEKISCYLLKADFNGFPKNRNLLFYTNEHNTLVAAVKTKQQ